MEYEHQSSKAIHIKIIMLGKSGSGRSQLYEHLVHKEKQNLLASINSVYGYRSDLKTNRLDKIHIWNIIDNIDLDQIDPKYFRGAFGGIFCFNHTDKQSFEQLDDWFSLVTSHTHTNGIPIQLVGLDSDKVELSEPNHISSEEVSVHLGTNKQCDLIDSILEYTSLNTSNTYNQKMIMSVFNQFIEKVIEWKTNLE